MKRKKRNRNNKMVRQTGTELSPAQNAALCKAVAEALWDKLVHGSDPTVDAAEIEAMKSVILAERDVPSAGSGSVPPIIQGKN
jgi:hypothetical protein